MKRIVIFCGAVIVLLLVTLIVRSLAHKPVHIEPGASAMAERLSESVAFQTVSYQRPEDRDP